MPTKRQRQKKQDIYAAEILKEDVTTDEVPAQVDQDGAVTKITAKVIGNSPLVRGRKEPNKDAEVKCILSRGDKVEILGYDGIYARVRISKGLEFYVDSNFLEEV